MAIFKKIFYASGGYDEVMEGWGFEDLDLNRRLSALGYKEAVIDLQFLKCISHGYIGCGRVYENFSQELILEKL